MLDPKPAESKWAPRRHEEEQKEENSSRIRAVWPPAARLQDADTILSVRHNQADVLFHPGWVDPLWAAAKVHRSPRIKAPAPQIITSLALLNLGDTTRTICWACSTADERCERLQRVPRQICEGGYFSRDFRVCSLKRKKPCKRRCTSSMMNYRKDSVSQGERGGIKNTPGSKAARWKASFSCHRGAIVPEGADADQTQANRNSWHNVASRLSSCWRPSVTTSPLIEAATRYSRLKALHTLVTRTFSHSSGRASFTRRAKCV